MSNPKKTTFTIEECYLMMFSEYEDIVTAQEAASMLRLPVKRVYRMFRAGEIKSFKDGRDVRTAKLWIIEYVQRYGFIRQESFRRQRKAAVTVFCQEPKSRSKIRQRNDENATENIRCRRNRRNSERYRNFERKGKNIADCCREKGISEAIYYRWKKEYIGLQPVRQNGSRSWRKRIIG